MLRLLFLHFLASFSLGLSGQTCDTLDIPPGLRYTAGGVQNSGVRVSFVPDRQNWTGREWAAAVTAAGRLVSEPVCIRQAGGTYYFDSLLVRRTADCTAEAQEFGGVGTPLYTSFLENCREQADTIAALPLVADTTYAGFYLVIYDPATAEYQAVSKVDTATFSANEVNAFGFSNELPPPTDSTGGLPGGATVEVGTNTFTSIGDALDNLVPVRDGLPERALKVYPNPSPGEVHLDIDPTYKIHRAVLYDLGGQQVGTWSLVGQSKRTLRLGGQPPGVYLLRVAGAGGQAVRRLVVY
jgi:hypothetical protein